MLTLLRRYATPLCVLALMLAPLLLFWPVTFGGLTLLPVDNVFQYEPFRTGAAGLGVGAPQNHLLSDLVLENYVWKQFILESIQHRELPLWNPYLFAGVPFLAAGQSSALYPPSLIYYLLPLEQAYGWYTVFNLGLAGVFMFVLARVLRVGRAGAVLAGVIYQLSGFLVASVVFQMVLGAAAWMPLILAMAENIIRQASIRGRPASAPWAVIGALAVCFQILAGHVEITLYTGLVAAAFCAWRILSRVGAGGWRLAATWRSEAIRPALWLATMALLGAGLGAIQLIPLFELVTQSFRAGRSDFSQVLSYGFPKSLGWLRWLMPQAFGSEAQHSYFDLFQFKMLPVPTPSGHTWWQDGRWKNSVEGGAYVGILSLMLAALAAARGVRISLRNRRLALGPGDLPPGFPRWFLVILAFLCVGFIFGTPLYALLYYGLPGINQLHSPFRWIFPLTVALALLAGAGLDSLIRSTPSPRLQRIGRLMAVSGAGLIGLVAAARLAFPAIQGALATVLARLELDRQGFTPALFLSLEGVNVLGLGVFVITGGLILNGLAGGRRRRWWAAAAIAVVVADCALAWTGFNPAVDPTLTKHVPAAIQFLKQDTELWRLTAFEPRDGKPLNANLAWWFNLQDIRGYDSIIPKQYVDYMQAIEPQGELPYNRIAPIRDAASFSSPLIDLLGVRYVVAQSADALASPGFTQVYDDGRTAIYRNGRALPRAFTLPATAAASVERFAEAARTMDPRRYAIFEARPALAAAQPAPAEPGPATITAYRNAEVWIDAPPGPERWLILADSDFPGWRAFIRAQGAGDDALREVAIERVNGNFRAVHLDASTTAQTVRFRYFPDSIRNGAFATFMALVSLLMIGGVWVWRARSQREEAHGVRLVARNSLVLTGLNLGARVIDMAFALIMLRALGPAGTGNYTFAVVIVSWFEILMNFGLNTYLIRDASRDRTHAFRYFIDTSLLRLALGAAAAPLIVLVIAVYAASDGISPETQVTLALLALSQLPGSLATGLSALFFAYDKAEVPAALTIVSALIKAAIGAVLLLSGWGIIGLAITSIATNLATLVMMTILARRILRLPFSLAGAPERKVSRVEIMREAFPLALNHLLSTIFWRLDVPLLKGLTRNESAVGYYTAGYKYIDAFNIIPSLFTQALFPTLSRMAGERRDDSATDTPLARAYVLAVKLLLMLALPLAVGVSFTAPVLIGVLGGQAFLPQGAIALAITIWHMPFGWINSVTNYALIAVGQQRRLTLAFVGAVAFNLIGNLIFIPRYGYLAAAVITALSEVIQLATFYFYVRRHITTVSWVKILSRPFLAAGLMAMAIYILAGAGQLAFGLVIGIAIYGMTLLALEALTPIDLKMLAPLLPARLRPPEMTSQK